MVTVFLQTRQSHVRPEVQRVTQCGYQQHTSVPYPCGDTTTAVPRACRTRHVGQESPHAFNGLPKPHRYTHLNHVHKTPLSHVRIFFVWACQENFRRGETITIEGAVHSVGALH